MNQYERALAFRALHDAPEAFVIANAWDAGSAKLLAALGFKALATSSGAHAGVMGRTDGHVTREEACQHAGAIAEATSLPVSADMEKGFGDTTHDAELTIALAASVGLVGASIEDATGDPSHPLLDPVLAAERIAAAARVAHGFGFPFMLTARTENYLRGNPDLNDTIRRLQAFEAAGADVLMAPGLPDLDAVRAVCAAVTKPVNFMAGIKGKSFTVAELAAAGVKRISLATSLYRAAMTGVLAAATEVRDHGTFGYLDGTLPTPDWNRFMTG
ncbi:MAG: isocitrate lyase/phosphoenolpyruvate mutase family protein [Acetobacteraceae bacterium]|nr:isocitrate lyase/phosphoenolpyruvate mutase family protein [Acetobacteraceae bacterium]